MQTLTLQDGHAALRCAYEDRERAKRIPGYTFHRPSSTWRYPISSRVVDDVRAEFPYCTVDPALLDAVARFIDRDTVVQSVKDAGWQNATPITRMPVTVTPFQHQVAAFNVAMTLDAVALLMEMGTGKTLTTVAALGARFLDSQIRRVLIVAPASVVPVWPTEFAQFADFIHDVRVLNGPVAKRVKQLNEWPTSYRCVVCRDELDTDDGLVCVPCGDRGYKQTARAALQVAVTNYEAVHRFADELLAWKPDAVVCDESQRIKTPSAAVSKAMHKIGAAATYRFALTGTPVTQHPMDFFSQYKFLDPSIFGRTFTPFRARYALMGGFEGRKIVGYRDLPDLIERAHSIAFRVTKDEAVDLPPQVDTRRYCELEPAAAKLYKQLADDAIAQLDSGDHVTAQNVLTKLLRLQETTGGAIHDDDGNVSVVSDAKLKLLDETLADALDGDGRKVVVFARFRKEIERIVRMVRDSGYDDDPCLIWGDTPMGERGDIVRAFQNDPARRVFVAQIQSAGLGITLTAADTAVFYSLDFNFANYDQARSRVHRIGQTRSVTNVHLLARGTVDEAVMHALARKRSVAEMVVDGGWRDVLEGRTSIGIDEIARKTNRRRDDAA